MQQGTLDRYIAAGNLAYEPNTNDYFQSSFVFLIASGAVSSIGVMLSSIGLTFKGAIAVMAGFQTEGGAVEPLSDDDFFWINYKEPIEEVQTRYAKWLDEVMIRGLAKWRRTLI
jgi:hypothetical protein